ncbi:DUF4880 domain-containing protein [Roseateles sp. DAIF2]|uniref:FecR family protein n=1 Tax=Roseateles sp. DAIF2 TaxID=2714952 RepID=UPI0018A28BF7|nr:FecR domain-containing protein [Roseateles sp. DAIF2]QPF74358.1 DUF4880 domain-containing protein [Roseateles sp. DAIF2]
MNFERTPQAEAQARHWVVRIDAGPLDAEERRALQQWLAADASHPRLLDEHALLWATASRAPFAAAAEGEGASPRQHAPRRGGAWLRPAGALASLGMMMMMALALLLWRDDLASPAGTGLNVASVHSTPIGTPAPVALPDGSRTELNAASTLRVAYSAAQRRVVLERGEGLFEVAKDRARPFEVLVGDTLVRAVGTRFLVQRRAGGRVEVTVYEGVVEVFKTAAAPAGARPIRLGVGQVAVSAPGQMLVALSQPQAMGRKLAWQHGRIEFDRSSLADALEEVNRYSAVPIRLGSAELGAMQVSGSFSTQETAVFLRSLEQGFGLRVQRSGEAWVLSQAPL